MRFALLLVSLVAWAAEPPAEFDSHAHETVMAPMRDGVRLATDVYRPARGGVAVEGRFPVVLIRTPYNKQGSRGVGAWFAQRGYVLVAQDCRGRFASEGDFYAFVNEGKDGYDAIEWAAAQPWSNGKVGTYGGSYLAWDQYHAAMYKPPHLAAMFAIVGGAVFYDEYAHPGGAPNLGWPMWILNSAASSPQAARNAEARETLRKVLADPIAWLAQHPAKRKEIFRDFPAHRAMYEDMYAHAELDAYWKQRGFYTPGYFREMKDVPVFFISGWYDYFGEGVLRNFEALARIQKTPKKLWMGPWPHGIGGDTCGDAAFGASAAVAHTELALDWFNHWMKGQPLRVIGPEPVRLFRMGGGEGGPDERGRRRHGGAWVTDTAWPPPKARAARWYIGDGGALAPEPAKDQKPSTFVFDPERPVPTIGGRYGMGSRTPGCAQNQVCSPRILGCESAAPLSARADVLSFSTAPLESPLEVTGKIRARLWVSSDAPGTDFTAKLVDVYPDGYAMILTDGQVRRRYRPGTVEEIVIDLGSTSNLFAAGHRIRVDLSSSNYPRIEPNPNTGEHAANWTARRKASNSIYHDARRPSHLELPVVAR
jgi:hypothetical protein